MNPNAIGPASLPYVEGKPAPLGYREDTQIRKGLVIGGAVTLGTFYIFSLLAASIISAENSSYDHKKNDSEALPLFVPTIGPFIAIATLDPGPVGTGWLVLDGVVQTASAIMIVTGLTSETKRYLRNDIVGMNWTVTPIVTHSHAGMGMLGRF